ncbi:hypothetical protein [Streptomyces sp. NPDC005336]|uniref:hypothetical protein n=1 Tax=Streptomyces sp. NPDC005336 TaxID=3157035 RepID=UPI0033B90257
MAGYRHAALLNDADYFPYVVFMVKNGVRRRELDPIFQRLPEEQQETVRVFLAQEQLATATMAEEFGRLRAAAEAEG